MKVGDPVEVYSAFEQTWASGFEIADVRDRGYGVRRTHDGALIPNTTSPDDLRPATQHHH